MQPVVQKPKIKMTELIDAMDAISDANPKIIQYQIEQLLAKVNRKKNNLTAEAISNFKVLTKEPNIESYLKKIEELNPVEAKKQIIEDRKVFELLEDDKAELRKLS